VANIPRLVQQMSRNNAAQMRWFLEGERRPP
jgi:hypothetical protein